MLSYLIVKNLILIKLIILLIFLSSCESIKKKSDEIVKNENEKLSQYIGITYEELKIAMGKPDTENYFDDPDNTYRLVYYKTKKYGISCERKFEVNSNLIVIGFVSNGCF